MIFMKQKLQVFCIMTYNGVYVKKGIDWRWDDIHIIKLNIINTK